MKNKSLFKAVNATLVYSQHESKKLQIYAFIDGYQTGPMSKAEIKTLINKGIITNSTLVWMPLMRQWEKASNIPFVNKWLLLYTQDDKTHKTAKSTLYNDIVAAMAKLGYKGKVVENIVDDILMSNSSISISDAIKLALSRLMKLF